MKTLLIGLPLLALIGCSSTPKQNYTEYEIPNSYMITDKSAAPMTRNEIIMAVQECEGNGLRPVLITAKRRIHNTLSEATVEVTCAPKFKMF